VNKGFKVGDYVFAKDRREIPGVTRPLRTVLSPSPCVVKRVLYSTVLIQRLADGLKSLYSMDDVKKYDATSPLFKYIPKKVAQVLLHDFSDLLSEDFGTITKYDELQIPGGIPLTLKYPAFDDPYKSTIGVTPNMENALQLDSVENELIQEDINALAEMEISKGTDDPEGKDSGDEEEEDEDNPGWRGRLRPRNKGISFAQK